MLAVVMAVSWLVWSLVRLGYRQGAADLRYDEDEKRKNMVVQAAAVRDRLRRDPDFSRRVRARFSR